MRWIFLSFLCFSLSLFCTRTFGQNTFTSKDTLNIREIKPKSKRQYDPDRAALLSAVFPGMGQLYNRQYWKVPIAWAGVGVLYYVYNRNNRLYKNYKNARINLVNPEANLGVDDDVQERVERLSSQTALKNLERAEANARRQRDFTIIIAAASYGIIIAEAYVDAHLKAFKISKDLSFKAKPSVQQPTYFSNSAYGVAFNFSFK
jgi:hypothetical protein